MPIVPIACNIIYQSVTYVGLKVITICIRHTEFYFIIMRSYSHAATHLAGVTAHAWSGKLDPGGEVPTFRMYGVG